MKNKIVTKELVQNLFEYTEDGTLLWKNPTSRSVKVGDKAGSMNKIGYVIVKINGKAYKAHRIIWLYHYGHLPKNDIDHIDRNKGNNRITNLREVSKTRNLRNRGILKSNTSGIAGVCYCNHRGKWKSYIKINGIQKTIGYFNDFNSAVQARLNKEIDLNWNDKTGGERK